MDYNEFSEKIKAKYPQYKDIDNRELAQRMVAKYPQYSDVAFDDVKPQKKGIDITPSALLMDLPQKAGNALASATIAPFTAARERIPYAEAVKQEYEKGEEARKIRNQSPIAKTARFATDIYGYSKLPMLRGGAGFASKAGAFGGNALIQGGIPGALEGLKEGEPLQGAGFGTGVAVGLQSLPYVGKLAKPVINAIPATGNFIARTVGRVQPETLQRAVQPDSVALDLTKDQAQNLLMNTTERVQNAYKKLLTQRGEDVNKAVSGLKDLEQRIDTGSLANDISSTFNQYGGDMINPARNLTGNLENDLIDLVNSGSIPMPEIREGLKIADNINPEMINTISPLDLQKAKEQVGKMVNWSDETARSYKNPILEQIYGKFNNRLNKLSPELEQANLAYEGLRDFQRNEGLKRILKPGDNIDNASSALRNYNSTVTSGNKNRNIQDLENVLIGAGENPFLNSIDDVNAAMDLLNARATGDSWLANMATQLSRPVLKGIRELNRMGLAEKYNRLQQQIPESVKRLIIPMTVRGSSPLVFGGISNYED